MIKRFAGITTALFLLGLAACSSPAPQRPLVASGHPDWPPVMFREGDREDGAGPALAKLIFDDLGIPSEFKYMGLWDEVQAKARTGEVDVLVAAYKTKAREEYMVYADAYVTDPLALYVKRGQTFTFEKYEDLIGKKGVGTVGDSYGQEFDDYIGAKLNFVRTNTDREAFDLVASGQADYFVCSLYSGHEELRKENRTGEFTYLKHFLAEEPFYITISKQSPYVKYLPEINRLIQKYKADGTVEKLMAKYKKQFLIE